MNELDELQQGRGPSVANEYDAMIDQSFSTQKTALQGAMFVAAKKEPARQAEVMAMSQDMKLPASIVERNFDDLKAKKAQSKIDYDTMIEKTPGFAKWMENVDNATLAREDIDPLMKIDLAAQKLGKRSDITTLPAELQRSATTGWRGIESSSWHLAAAYGLATPEQAAEQVALANKRSNELRAQMPDYAKEFNEAMASESGDVNKAFNKFTGFYQQSKDGHIMNALKAFAIGGVQTVGEALDMIGAAARRPRGLMYTTVESLANSAPALVTGLAAAKGGAAAGALTGPAAPFAIPALAIGGMAVGSFAGAVPVEVGAWINQEMGARGIDITDPQALTAAYKDSKLMADIRGEAERKGITTAGVDALFNAFAGKLLKGAKPGMASKLAAGAGDIGIQAVGEASSEYAGQVAAKKGDLSKANFGEAIQEGIVSLGHSVADTAAGVSMRTAFNKNPVRAAEEVAAATDGALKSLHEAQTLAGIGEAVKELKHAGGVPGKLAELVNAGAAPAHVYFQTNDWDKYWRAKGKSPAKQAELLMDDGGKAYFEAKQTGQEIEISFSQYVEKTARTDDFEGLLPSAKLSPDSMSMSEAQEHLASLPATMQELAKEATPTPTEQTAEQSAAQVGQTVSEQLKAVGVDPQQAVIYEEGFRVLGERMGTDPKELFDQYKLRITGEQSPAAEGQTYNQDVEKAPTFYSKLTQTIEQKMGGSQDSKSLRAMLKDIKPEEMKWSGLEELLSKKDKVTKQEVLEHLAGHQLQIQEVTKEAGGLTGDGRGKVHTVFFDGDDVGTYDSVQEAESQAEKLRNDNEDADINIQEYDVDQYNRDYHGGETTTQFEKYVLPGGENYREMLFTLPPAKDSDDGLLRRDDIRLKYQPLLEEIRHEIETGPRVNIKENEAMHRKLLAQRDAEMDAAYKPIGDNPDFKSSHWDEKNVLAHVRLNDRVDAEGKKVLFVEEIQSDWHQAGRKKGYKSDIGDADGLRKERRELLAEQVKIEREAVSKAVPDIKLENFQSKREVDLVTGDTVRYEDIDIPALKSFSTISIYYAKRDAYDGQHKWEAYFGRESLGPFDTQSEAEAALTTYVREQALFEKFDKTYLDQDLVTKFDALEKRIDEIDEKMRTVMEGVPDAPFRKTWHEFALKKILGMAVEGGYDKVAWTTGDQQNERYDLSKQVKTVAYDYDSKSNRYAITGQTLSGSWNSIGVFDEANLDEAVGKDLAEKMIAHRAENKGKWEGPDKVIQGSFSGVDLKVGGDGMKGFYDKIVPSFLSKFGKKFGATVGSTELQGLESGIGDGDNYTVEQSEVTDLWYVHDEAGEGIVGEGYSREASAIAAAEKLNTQSRGGNKVHSMDITPALKESALKEGFTLFQQEGDDVRGQIHISTDGINISIHKNANASTFIHETGHFYLEVLKDLAARAEAPGQIKDDFQAIREWLGLKEGEDLQVAHHEQFARGFEGYLMDGKAPTSKLAKAFARFKVWLISVYRNMRPTAEFSKEVREVMNRLFATDEELNIAEGNYLPLFSDPAQTGMSEKQAERYMEARMEARIAAEEELTAKLMDDFRKSEQAFYKEKRKEVRKEAEAELINLREYRALAILQGEFKVGKDNQNFKISQKSLKEIGAKNMPRGISAKDGLHVEIAATLLQYLDGAALVKALSGLPSLNEATEKLTDMKMAEYYPDSLTDGTLPERTIQAMHNDKRAQLLRMELEHLVSNNPAANKDIVRKLVRRMPTQKQVRDEAMKIIGATKSSMIKPHLYQRAEVKSAKEAGEAYAKGDIDAAFEAKQRELLNHELYRESVNAKEMLDKAMVDFRRFKQSDEKISKTRDMDLVTAGRAILAAFGIGQQGSDEFLAQEILAKMQKYDPEMYAVARALYDDATENGSGPWQSVPFNDFVAMKQSVDALWDLAKSTKQIEIEGVKRDLEEVKGELMAQASKFVDPKAKKQYTETAGPWQKVKSKLLSAKADLVRVEHWAEAMDTNGNREFSNYMFRPIADAVTKYRLAKSQVIQQYHQIVKSHEKNLSPDPIESDEIGHRFKNKAELMMAVLHTGNESNMRKLLVGRKWGSVNEDGAVDASRWNQFIDRMQKEGVLTKADYDFAQQIWDLLESLKGGAQLAHKQMYGYYFKEITTDGFSTPFGDYRGGYIPAKLDVNESEDADIRQERESFEKNNNSYQFPTTGRGFTKSRVEQYAGPLSLDMNLLGGHIDGVLRFTNIEPRVKEVSRIVMDKEFRAALREVDPAVAKDALVPWLQRAAQQQVVTPSRDGLGRLTDAMASKLRSTVAVQLMFGNITNSLQQLTGVIVAGVKIKPRHLRNALATYLSTKGAAADIAERSEWMRSTQNTNVFETAQAIQNIIVNPTTFESMQQFAKKHTYFLQSAFQNLVNSVVWIAGYNQALEEGRTEAQAVKDADSKVRMTQGTVNPEDVSRFETGTQTERLFKQFVGYFNMLANLNGFEIQKIARETGLKKGAGKAFYVYMMGIMIPAVLSEVIVRAMSGKGFDEDDDDSYLDDAMSAFFGSQFKTIGATVPYGGQLAVSAYNRFNNQRYDDRLSLSPVISVLEGTAGIPFELYKNIAQDVDNEKRITKDVLTLIGLMSSLPAGPIGKPVGYMMDISSGKAQPSGPIDFTRGMVTGKSGQ